LRTALLVVIGLLAFASPAFADTTYTDSAGEDAAAADITSVVVSNDPAAHTVTFKVQVANMPALEDNAVIGIVFDSDHNPATGDPDGFDSDFILGKPGFAFERWDGTQYTQVTGLGIQVTYTNGLMTAVFHESDLAATLTTFDFFVLSLRGPDPNNPVVDSAPDGPPIYQYTLATAPAVPATPTVKGSTVAFKIAPKAGKKAVVGPLSVTLTDGTSVTATSEHCSATLGGTHLTGTGSGGCTFTLPKKAKGKRLVVKVTGRYGASTLSRSLSSIVT
jgi:hypothetical protein